MGFLRPARTAMLAGLMVLLGGCVTVDGRFEIGMDQQMSVDLLVELDPATAASRYAGDACQILEQDWPWMTRVRLEPTTRQGTVGCRLRTAVEVSEADPELDRSYQMDVTGLAVEHHDGKYLFRWDPGYANAEAVALTDHFQVQVSFPGEVREHSGTAKVAGTTVTWTSMADLMGDGGLVAVGDDRPGPSILVRNPLSWAVVALFGTVAGFVISRHRRRGHRVSVDLREPDGPPPEPGQPLFEPGHPIPEPALSARGEGRPGLPPEAWAPGPVEPAAPPAPSPPRERHPPEVESPWAPPG